MDDRPLRSLFQREPGIAPPPGAEPAEVDLSAEDQEKVQAARDLLAILLKTFKAFRIYLANNELLIRFQQELNQKFSAFLNRYEALELRIRPATITLMGQPVYRSSDQEDNLAQHLFRDGLRRITFHIGLPPEEVAGFLDVLKKNADHTVEHDFDVVTLFWEKDFKFITYHAVEELLPEGVEVSEFEAQTDEQIERIATLNFYTDEDSVFEESAFALASGQKRQDIYDNLAPSEESILKSELASHFLALATEEIRKIQSEIKEEKPEDLLLDMADTVLEVIFTERSFDDFKVLLESMEQILQTFVNLQDLERATEILKRLHFLAQGYQKTSKKAAEVVEQVIERASSVERLQPIFSAMGQGTLTSVSIFGNFLLQLGKSAIPYLGKVLAETTNADFRKTLCDVLILFGKEQFDLVFASLDERSEKTLQNKIYILNRIGDDRAVQFLRKLMSNPSGGVRQMVVSSLARFYNPVTRDILFLGLQDKDEAVRIATLKNLQQTKDPKVLDQILSILRAPDFHEKNLPEKRVFFMAMASLGGNGLVESLGSILSRNNLKDKGKDDEIRICAAEALGMIASPDAIDLLQKGLKINRKEVAKACREQISRLEEREVNP